MAFLNGQILNRPMRKKKNISLLDDSKGYGHISKNVYQIY